MYKKQLNFLDISRFGYIDADSANNNRNFKNAEVFIPYLNRRVEIVLLKGKKRQLNLCIGEYWMRRFGII